MLTTSEHGRTLISGYLRPSPSAEHATDAVFVETPRYTGRIGSWMLGTMPVSVIEDPNRATVTRYLDLLPEPPCTHLVGVLVKGSGSLSTESGTVRLAAGTITLYSSGSPFVLRFDDAYHYVVAEVPDEQLSSVRSDLDLLVADPDATRAPATRLAVDLLAGLPGNTGALAPYARSVLGDALAALLREAVHDVLGGSAVAAARDELRDTIVEWIEQHLAEEDLSPARIAAAHYISVRYLHRIFQSSGTTVGELIRRRRIERIKAELATPASRALPVATVGARWGLSDPNALNRQFRAHVGTTPGRWRQDMARPA